MTVYKVYADPGHAWVRVLKTELASLGIANSVSSYSYQRGEFAYLKEDCDASLWLAAKQHLGHDVTFSAAHTNNQSRIRNYQSYRSEL